MVQCFQIFHSDFIFIFFHYEVVNFMIRAGNINEGDINDIEGEIDAH